MQRIKYLLLLLILCACQPSSTTLPSTSINHLNELHPTETFTPSDVPPTEMSTPLSTSTPPFPTDTPTSKERFPMDTSNVTITIVYDNYLYDNRLITSWGFAALVEAGENTLLFDTGGDGSILLDNMKTLGIDPTTIESVVLSHIHGDHTGGLITLLQTGIQPTVFLPPSFPSTFKRQLEQFTTVIEVEPGQKINEWMFTTGEMGTHIPEQSLFVQSPQGGVVITGCAHPGIVKIVEEAKSLSGAHLHLVLGGFHLGSKSRNTLASIVADFRRLGVEKVAPCHCTGDQAIAMFQEEYGEDFIQAGAGKVIIIEP